MSVVEFHMIKPIQNCRKFSGVYSATILFSVACILFTACSDKFKSSIKDEYLISEEISIKGDIKIGMSVEEMKTIMAKKYHFKEPISRAQTGGAVYTYSVSGRPDSRGVFTILLLNFRCKNERILSIESEYGFMGP